MKVGRSSSSPGAMATDSSSDTVNMAVGRPMRLALLPPLLAIAIAAVATAAGISCHSSSAFPFSGPGCTGPTYSDACWECLDHDCNASCAAVQCAAWFECLCACDPDDAGCSSACVHDPACVSCEHGIANDGFLDTCVPCRSVCFPEEGGADDAGLGE
jgi:hypothetical protein